MMWLRCSSHVFTISFNFLIYSNRGLDNQQQHNDNNNKSPNEKATQAYKLFDEENKPVQAAYLSRTRFSFSIQYLKYYTDTL